MHGRETITNPQAPEVSRFARRLGVFRFNGAFWIRLHVWGVKHLPSWLTYPLMPIFAFCFQLALGSVRRALAANHSAIFGRASWPVRQWRIFRTIHVFSWCLTERYEWLTKPIRQRVTTEGEGHWRKLAEEGRGSLVVTAHLGNWEIGSALPARQESRVVHLVREPEMDPDVQKFFQGLIEGLGDRNYITHFASQDPGLALKLREALGRNELVALQGDRPRAGSKTISVKLFDRPYELPRGPFALARVSGCPIIPVFMLREGRFRYRVIINKPIRIESRAEEEKAAAQLAKCIETSIRRKPHQWFCFHAALT